MVKMTSCNSPFLCAGSVGEYIRVFVCSSHHLVCVGADRDDLCTVTARRRNNLLDQAVCDTLSAVGGIDLRVRDDPVSALVFDLCKSDAFFAVIRRRAARLGFPYDVCDDPFLTDSQNKSLCVPVRTSVSSNFCSSTL